MVNTNASNTEPHDLQTPSNAHVPLSSNIVTQSTVFGDYVDTQLTTPSHNKLRTYLLGVEHHYHDTSISFQSPEATIPTVACIDTPMVHSPNQALISASFPLVKSDTPHKLKRQMFQDKKLDAKRKRK